jgi:hypothetical protein
MQQNFKSNCLIFMKKIITTILASYNLIAFGQQNNNLKVSLQLQPELTIHQNQYSNMVLDKYNVGTFNLGISSSVQYDVTKKIFIDFGVGYIQRKLNTSATFVQSALPAPYTSFSKELVHTQSLTYNTLQIPINIGYVFLDKNKLKSYLLVGGSANYLLGTYYDVGTYTRTYKKGYLQGASVNVGLGYDYKINKNVSFTNSLSYSIFNSTRKDDFLEFRRSEGPIALPHNYLRLSFGIKAKL